jgi:peptidyl-prolyl cis-trans isomerase C
MGRPPRVLAAAFVALALTAKADGDDTEVLHVGDASIRVRDVEVRLAKMPAFQLRAYGTTDGEVRHRIVDEVLVPELLAAEDAKQRRFAEGPRAARRIREALARALGTSILDAATTAGVPEDEGRRYYDTHRDDYEKPERIRISRILIDDDALARKILSEAAGTAGLDHWNEFARQNSLDAATKMRGGMLGFIYPDGRTESPQVAVDPALYRAAATVRDGELVPEPVKEGTHLAVVWRRGTLSKLARTYESVRDEIRALLVRERAEKTLATLKEDLRRGSLKDYDAGPLESLDVGDPKSSKPAPRPSTSGATVDPVPHPSERGLR